MEEILQQTIKILAPFTEFAFVLGSFGTPRYRSDSDIDLAVYYKAHVTKEDKLKLWGALEDLTGRDVDLVELNFIDPIFARQVIETGRELINDNPALLLQWKCTSTSMYVDFKFDRSIIEKNILNRKKL
jgi:predicted nucleotidyltransferase